MATIIAIFDDMNGLTEAQDVLSENGADDAVRHVVDHSGASEGAEGTAPVVAGSQLQGAVVDRTDPDRPWSLGGLDLPDEEASWVRRAVDEGARAIVLDGDDAERAAGLIEPHAERLVRLR